MRLQNGFWCYVGESYPAGKWPDISITKREYPEIKKRIRHTERRLVDLGWSSEMANTEFFIFGHKKTKNTNLEDWQIAENKVLGHYRGI